MKKSAFRAILVVVVLLAEEVLSFVAIRVLYARGYLTGPPRPASTAVDYAHYLRIQREGVGWPLKEGVDEFGGAYRDRTGARRLPAFPDPDISPSCVSLYGDSFVQGVRVDAEHTWANLLAKKLGCRVSNYGQGGYGSDQALLRYELNPQDEAPVVILGHMDENIRRNLTRIRDLISGGRDYALKPRFILDPDGQLELVPMPELTEDQYARAVGQRSPMLLLEHEDFQPGGPLVAAREHFPYTLSLIRALGDHRFRSRLNGNQPYQAECYEPGNVTQGLELMVALVKAFQAEAQRRGQIGLMLFLPSREAIQYYLRTRIWIHQPLLDRLRQEKIPYMDFGPFLVAHSDDVLNEPFERTEHLNRRGEALLALMVATELERRKVIDAPAQVARQNPDHPTPRLGSDAPSNSGSAAHAR